MAEVDETTNEIQTKVLQTTITGISSLKSTNPEGDDGNGESSQPTDCCVICLDCISEPCAALPCAHAHFDFLCLLGWLQERPTCPLCKSTVYKVRYEDTKAGESIYRVPISLKTRHDNSVADTPQSTPADYLRRRQRRQRSPEAVRGVGGHISRPGEAIQLRRQVYRHQLYSLRKFHPLHLSKSKLTILLPDVGSNRLSRYTTPPTPQAFATIPHLVSRARLWIRRELQVFSLLSDSPSIPDNRRTASTQSPQRNQVMRAGTSHSRRRDNAEFLLEYIIAILKTVDIQGSAGQAEDMLSDFLGRDDARLFLHELRSWLRSPCQSLVAWDREVQYPQQHRIRPSPANEVSDGQNEGPPGRSVDSEGSRAWQDSRGGDHWRASGSSRKWRFRGSKDGSNSRQRSRE